MRSPRGRRRSPVATDRIAPLIGVLAAVWAAGSGVVHAVCGGCSQACTNPCVSSISSCPAPTHTPNSLWSGSGGGAGVVPPSSDIPWSLIAGCYPYGLTFSASGADLRAFNNCNANCEWCRTFSSTIQNFVNPVPLKNGTEAIFLAQGDGKLHGVRALDGADLAGFPIYLGRAMFADSLIATPAVWLYNSSSDTTFRDCTDTTKTCPLTGVAGTCAAGGDDIVFVVTRHVFTDTSDNHMFAICASSGTTYWDFRPSNLGLAMDYGAEGPAIDYGSGPNTTMLYFGTAAGGGAQPTLWKLNATNGTLPIAARNVGPLTSTRPALRAGRVYVGTDSGTLLARSPSNLNTKFWAADPFPLYSNSAACCPVAPCPPNPSLCPIFRPVWPEFRGGFSSQIFVAEKDRDVDMTFKGFVKRVTDLGISPNFDWQYPMATAGTTGMAGISIPFTRGYVGTGDGRLQQFLITTGAVDAIGVVNGGPGTVSDVTMQVHSPSSSEPDRLAVNGTSSVKQYCAPWSSGDLGLSSCLPGFGCQPCTSDADCRGDRSSCTNECPSLSPGSLPQTCGADGAGNRVCQTQYELHECATAVCNKSNPDPAFWHCQPQALPDKISCSNNNPSDCAREFVIGGDCDRACAPGGPQLCDQCQGGFCVGEFHDADGCGGCDPAGANPVCCSPACVNTFTDSMNCGGCGNVCPTGEVCVGGVCQCNITCAAPTSCCVPPSGQATGPSGCQPAQGAFCTDLKNDGCNCGFCGQDCNGFPCVDGRCQYP